MLLADLDVPIETLLGTLRLRALTLEDAPAFAAHVRGDMPRLGEHLNWPAHGTTTEGARALLDRYVTPGGRSVSIAGAFAGEEIVAGSLLVAHDEAAAGIELGVWATARGAGTGAAAEACRGLVAAARRDLAVERIAWRAPTDNPRSRALAERLGFQLEGVLRRSFRLHGTLKDTWILSLVEEEIDRCVQG